MCYTIPWAEDAYLMTSFFRDLSKEAKAIGKNFRITIPDGNLYPGEEYFNPFAEKILEIIDQLS